MAETKRKMRWWVAVLIVALVGGMLVWMWATENVMRQVALVLYPIFGLILLALWYIFLTGLPWGRRLKYFGILMLVLVGTGVGLNQLTRWEGSTSGAAIPRLAWKWTKRSHEELATLAPRGGTATLAANAASFPQFLGPDRTGVLAGVQLDPDWKAHPPQELWRRPIGAGWSAFAVEKGRAVTQEQRGEEELVSCYDLGTGEPLWTHSDRARFSEAMGGDGPRATPTIHAGRVYTMGGTGILNCLDLESGRLAWTRDVLKDLGAQNVMWGKSCSPLLVTGTVPDQDLVVVTGGGEGGPMLAAYHRESGERLWKAGSDASGYASAVLATLRGRQQILSMNQNGVTGHDIASGEILWTWDWPANNPKVAQPQVVEGDRILVSASYGLGSALLQVQKEGEDFEVEKVWKGLRMKTKFSNTCIRGGYAYGLDEGRISCIELATGKRKWRGDKYGYGQNLLVGDHLLIQGERGFVALVEANPEEFKEVARLEALSEMTWNNPVLAGEYLLVRNDREAVCYRVKLR